MLVNELHLFAGAGGGILGGQLLGHTTVCAVEIEPYCRKVLLQRQRDGYLPKFPIWDDIRTFEGTPWRGTVDIVCGGFPCQDISPARAGGEGITGSKSSLWFEMLRVVSEVQPEEVFIENSHHLRTKGLGLVLQGLSDAGYDATWCVLSAGDCGANHERKRMWILGRKTSNPDSPQCEGRGLSGRGNQEYSNPGLASWWEDTTHLDGMDDGVANRMDRLKAIGNGQVPIVAATAYRFLKEQLT
jgi:DNA (cytosine-5)-methyltransferase 1